MARVRAEDHLLVLAGHSIREALSSLVVEVDRVEAAGRGEEVSVVPRALGAVHFVHKVRKVRKGLMAVGAEAEAAGTQGISEAGSLSGI